MSESSLGKQRVGDGGESCGVIHFHRYFFPKENSKCNDDEYVLNRAAEIIKAGEAWKYFTPCSCIQQAKAVGATIPSGTNASDLEPNIGIAELQVNDLVLFRDKSGKAHVGVFKGRTEAEKLIIDQSNWEACKSERWYLSTYDPLIYGYWAFRVVE